MIGTEIGVWDETWDEMIGELPESCPDRQFIFITIPYSEIFNNKTNMSILQTIEGWFGHKTTTTPSTPSEFQLAVNEAGAVVDELESIFEKFQPLVPVLPQPFQGFLSAIAVALHSTDSYLDTLEVKPAPPTPVPAPTPPKP